MQELYHCQSSLDSFMDSNLNDSLLGFESQRLISRDQIQNDSLQLSVSSEELVKVYGPESLHSCR